MSSINNHLQNIFGISIIMINILSYEFQNIIDMSDNGFIIARPSFGLIRFI
jgi:hypothetical protein